MVEERIELTVRLSRDGDVLRRSYFDPIYGHRKKLDSSAPWSSFTGGIEFQNLAGPEAIGRLFDRGRPHELKSHLTRGRLVQVGELLFDLLFGAEQKWEPLLRGLFNRPSGARPNPPRHPVRVRVLAEDPLLAGLPWRITAWRGRWLLDSGWTFETVASQESRGHVEVREPARVLVVAPGGGESLATDDHLADLREALAKVSLSYRDESFFARVETREALAAALRGMRPDVVYYFGHGAVDGNQACLILGQEGSRPDMLAMSDLSRLLASAPPPVVYLNACMAGATGWLSAGHQLISEVPCVVAHRTNAWSGQAGHAFSRWLEDFLGRGLDPVVALHRLPAGGSTRGFAWATSVVWTSFQSWKTHRETASFPRRQPGLRLDRDHQRALALKHVNDLILSRVRRVEAMVVYGEAGTLVEGFGDQLRHHLESYRIGLRWIRIGDEGAGDRPFDHLEEVLGLWLERQPFESIEALLRRRAPRLVLAGSTPVLCLDWGTFGTGERSALTAEELQEWLVFCSDILAQRCPSEIRVISYLAMVVKRGNQPRLQQAMTGFRSQIRSQQFRCSLLPALAEITLIDLLDYLEDSTNTHCPSSLAREGAELIFQTSAGNYERTIELIREGEEEGWQRLLRKLRTSHRELASTEAF